MPSLGIAHRPECGLKENRFQTYRWRRVYRRATDERAVPPLETQVQAIQLSPYRADVAGRNPTRLQAAPALHPCSCPLLLSDLGEVFASKSSTLNFGHLGWLFARCATWRTVSPQAAQAFQTLCGERGRARGTAFTIRAWSLRTL
jgi:hypothetical protein